MNTCQFDELFDYFLSKFGEPQDRQPISELVVSTYRRRLPEQLFTYWRGLGACGFANGLWWMTDPNEYQDLLDSWLEDTPFADRQDLSVIARTAFGELNVWAKGRGNVMDIEPNNASVFYFPGNDNLLSDAEEEKKCARSGAFRILRTVIMVTNPINPFFSVP